MLPISETVYFNTMNMIAEKAYLEDADETAELVENVAEMFRYSLDFSGKIVKLQKEIEELGNYIFIQEQRYGRRIRFNFQIDEIFHDIEIPALSLQPLVENSIIHGIGLRTENNLIMIITKYDELREIGQIIIWDNGIGMSDSELQKVREEMKNYKGDGVKIGLGNVYLRLKMYYNGKASMEITSREGEGTRVMIEIPYKTKQAIALL